ncbi:MAG: TetR/AcrR family transcriptional regulator [Spirochaetes bacterium]|nr:MAG: TetR/AcrR family transcriptional regulator [Spirochaetota bacterium]
MGRRVVQEERRLQIIEALFSCLMEKPFKETSIKDIAKAAGVNHGVLHYYFTGKEEILLTFLDHMLLKYKGEFYEYMSAHTPEGAPARQVISEMFSFVNRRITLDRRLSRIFVEIWEIGLYEKKVRVKLKAVYREWIRSVQAVIAGAVKDEIIARRMSTAVVAFLEGMSMLSVILEQSKEESAATLLAFQERIIEMLD